VVEKPDAKEKKIERVVGVDIGIKSTVATSDGEEIGHFSDRLKRKLGAGFQETEYLILIFSAFSFFLLWKESIDIFTV